ncbi:MAG TPA: hypothetical protein VK509_16245, partial [Polyangiales bacterium]|nr:hypothetical protein [Polyangiales bacterium]
DAARSGPACRTAGSAARFSKPRSDTVIAQLARTFALALLAVLSACASPLVGAECRKGLSRCDGQCIDVERDPEHCGSCANDCGRLECRNGRCGPGVLRPDEDGGSFVADGGGGPPINLGGVGTPFTPDGGLNFPDPLVDGCLIGETVCNDKCTDPFANAAHCGGCNQPCDSGLVCGNGVCVAPCEAMQTMCGAGCVATSTSTSPSVCGPCAITCASGICAGNGSCDDAVPGHLVIIGHDYSTELETSATMKRIAGNALFLARGKPVRALVYRGSASAESVAGVEAAIDFTTDVDGRAWTRTDADENEVPLQLRGADALIIHAQADASDAKLIDLGRRWGRALAQFLQLGGVILVFETPTKANSGTSIVLRPIGVFRAARRTEEAPQALTVVSPGVGVAARATSKYRSGTHTVRFVGITTPGGPVVEDSDGEVVVFHRIVSPP